MKPYEEFQEFLKKFVSQIDPDDQLPIRVSNYTITESEFKPEVTNFARQYLQDNDCPTVLLNAIVNNVLADVLDPSKESPLHCGFEAIQNHYQPLKLMQAVISKVNAVCSRLLDNAELMKLMPEDCVDAGSVVPALPKYSAMGVKNSRRKMEDRHVVIQDFHELYSGKKSPRCSYYGLFDGHGGAEAAIYSVAHLAYHLRNSNYYPEYPGKAISDAFNETDQAIISKYHTDSFRSGTTALVVLHFPDEKLMNVAWVGDSQALIVKNGETVQIVKSHKATEQSERDRIIEAGGEIFQLQGVFRVQGQIAITRAIGDTDLKQFIISEPEIVSFELDGDEDFVIMASDGLWDVVSDDGAASEVYNRLKEDPGFLQTK